jgi:hypothetical protein
MGASPDSGLSHHRRLSREINERRKVVADLIIDDDLTVPDVYALLYRDEVDWDIELATRDAEDGLEVRRIRL